MAVCGCGFGAAAEQQFDAGERLGTLPGIGTAAQTQQRSYFGALLQRKVELRDRIWMWAVELGR